MVRLQSPSSSSTSDDTQMRLCQNRTIKNESTRRQTAIIFWSGSLPHFFPVPQTFCNAFAYFFVVACLLVELVYVLMVAPHPRSFFHRQSMGIYFICIIYNLLLVSLYFRSKPSSFGCCICISSCSLYAMQLDNSNAICIGNVTIISLRYIATKSMINPACQYFFLHRHRFPRPLFTSLSQVC